MKYEDAVYGVVEITEAVILDVMASKAVQRLHGVLQHGITATIGLTNPISRFGHSMGAMLLVRLLGATVEEQIAALLHDVSHTAFSHVIDHVFDSPDTQSYHDLMKEGYVAGTDLPAIFHAHNYDWHIFLYEENFPLLEQPSPALCADRLDYSLRDALDIGMATSAQVANTIAHLIVHDGRIVMDDADVALWLADTFMGMDDASWSNWREVGLYELTGRAIRRGLDVGAIVEADIWTTDAEAWAKLNAHADPELQRLLGLVSLDTTFVWDDENPTFRLSTKIRTIDPDVLVAGQLHKLSALNSDYAQRRAAYIAKKSGVWAMRVVGG